MRDYAKIRPVFWIKGTGRKLRGDLESQIVALYLMSAPLSHMSGLYYLPFPTLCHETGVSEEGARKALARLSDEEFAHLDEDTDTVFVTNMAREQVAPSMSASDKRVKGIMTHLEDFKNHRYYQDFVRVYARPFSLPVKLLAIPEGASPKPHGKPRASTSAENIEQRSRERPPPPSSQDFHGVPPDPVTSGGGRGSGSRFEDLRQGYQTRFAARDPSGMTASEGKHFGERMSLLSKWSLENSLSDEQCGVMLDNFFADIVVADKGFGIGWLAQRPGDFLRGKPLRLGDAADPDDNPTHRPLGGSPYDE